ncbi:DUF2933 domain-containing protein [Delftia deserti]|uniref:DUF2933 domain-containing protein n=1 Tax=Delftia deserti TaxID=1651218 RepID=A0ABW5EIM0_9BURK
MFPILPGSRAIRNHNHTTRQTNLTTFCAISSRMVRSRYAIGGMARAIVAGYLFGRNTVSIWRSGALCCCIIVPLMHLFMHKGHGSGTTGIEKNRDTASSVQ